MKTAEALSFTFPKEMVTEIKTLARDERKTKSQLVRDALNQYIQTKRWREVQKKMALRARVLGITSEEDVNRLIHEYRRGNG